MHHKLPTAITFNPTVGFSSSISFQKWEVKTFPKVSRSTRSDEVEAEGRRLETHVEAINSHRHPSDQKRNTFF